MKAVFRRILSVSLVLLYFMATTGFGVLHCNHHSGKAKVILAGEKTECCCSTPSISDVPCDISFENDNQPCCAFSFQVLEPKSSAIPSTNHAYSSSFKLLQSPAIIPSCVDFAVLQYEFPFKKPSCIHFAEQMPRFYLFCQLRN